MRQESLLRFPPMAAQPTDEPSDSPVPWWKRRSVRVVGVVVLASLVLVLIACIWVTLSVRRALTSAQSDLRQARSDLLTGEGEAAVRSFADAGIRFRGVAKGFAGTLLSASADIPGFGHSATTMMSIADAGARAADAGDVLAKAVVQTPGGLASLAPSDGGLV